MDPNCTDCGAQLTETEIMFNEDREIDPEDWICENCEQEYADE